MYRLRNVEHEDMHVLDSRGILSPRMSAELIERYSFEAWKPHFLFLSPVSHGKKIYSEQKYKHERARVYTACRLNRFPVKIN